MLLVGDEDLGDISLWLELGEERCVEPEKEVRCLLLWREVTRDVMGPSSG